MASLCHKELAKVKAGMSNYNSQKTGDLNSSNKFSTLKVNLNMIIFFRRNINNHLQFISFLHNVMIQVAVFKISVGQLTLTGKIWICPTSFPSLSYINFGKIVLRSGEFQILFWRLRTYLVYTVNIMAADDLVTQGTRASSTMILT